MISLSLTESRFGQRIPLKTETKNFRKICFSDTQRQNRLSKLFQMRNFEGKMVCWNTQPNSSSFPFAPLPPTSMLTPIMLASMWEPKTIHQHWKWGGGGLFYCTLKMLSNLTAYFIIFAQFCQQFRRCVSETNFFISILVDFLLHRKIVLNCSMRIQYCKLWYFELWRHNFPPIWRHFFPFERQFDFY